MKRIGLFILWFGSADVQYVIRPGGGALGLRFGR